MHPRGKRPSNQWNKVRGSHMISMSPSFHIDFMKRLIQVIISHFHESDSWSPSPPTLSLIERPSTIIVQEEQGGKFWEAWVGGAARQQSQHHKYPRMIPLGMQ
ncbi:hypothetical protein Pelo_18560 [Pelomyxa schiedti]|nr:hypothetical protein Pelo_18560 [Pelomyxa schiedti]